MKHIDGNLALDDEFFGTDSFNEVILENESVVYFNESTKNKARKRRKNAQKAKNKLKRLSKIGGYPQPAFPVKANGRYAETEEETVRYKRVVLCGNNGGVGKWLQRITNKRIRKSDNVAMRGKGYRRFYDKMWELF